MTTEQTPNPGQPGQRGRDEARRRFGDRAGDRAADSRNVDLDAIADPALQAGRLHPNGGVNNTTDQQ